MSIVSRTLVLTGGRAGKTCVVGKSYRFVDGKLTIRDSAHNVEALTHWLGVNYAAFPEGSAELEAHNGQRDLSEDSEPERLRPEVLGGVQSGEQGTAEVPEADGSAGDDADGAPVSQGALPEGDGHPDSRIERIQAALNQLDVMDDAHWTTTGLPAMAVVEQLLGESITRAELSKVAPDFTRER